MLTRKIRQFSYDDAVFPVLQVRLGFMIGVDFVEFRAGQFDAVMEMEGDLFGRNGERPAAAGIDLHLEPGRGFYVGPCGGLEIAVVAGRLKSRDSKLRGDVLGGNIQPARRSGATLEQIRGNKGKVSAKRVGGNMIENRLHPGRNGFSDERRRAQ